MILQSFEEAVYRKTCFHKNFKEIYFIFRHLREIMPLEILTTITCSKLTIETLDQGVKYIQN